MHSSGFQSSERAPQPGNLKEGLQLAHARLSGRTLQWSVLLPRLHMTVDPLIRRLTQDFLAVVLTHPTQIPRMASEECIDSGCMFYDCMNVQTAQVNSAIVLTCATQSLWVSPLAYERKQPSTQDK